MRGSKAASVPLSASTESEPMTSAVSASISAASRPSTPTASIACVPLMSEMASLASRTSGLIWPAARAAAPGILLPRRSTPPVERVAETKASPSPMRTTADVIGSLSVDALKGTDAAFDPRIKSVRPHAGQTLVAANLRRMLEGSTIRDSHRDCARVQDAYSLRCIPQVHGAVRDTLAFCRRTFEIEMNSAVDNPLVFVKSHGEGDIISGGNFHGEPLAFALDYLAIALSALAGISERRIERLVNPALNEDLPPFLAPDAGMNSGFMMPQVTAAALVSENKVLAHPASVDSITTSGNKEDYVSMGMTAANKLARVVDNARNVLAIEALCAAQALDFLAPLKTSKRGQVVHAAIRAAVPTMEQDRSLANDFIRVAELIRSGALIEKLS